MKGKMSELTTNDKRNFKIAFQDQLDILEEIVDWVGQNLHPEDVFSDEALSVWATFNGYELPENI